MSDKEATVTEWKTVRVSAVNYYKLVELSGLLTALFGAKVPLSLLAEIAFAMFYDFVYQKARKMLDDPKEIKRSRKMWKEFEGEMAQLIEIISKK